MTDDILRQQDGQGNNNDSDIRMRNGSAMRNLADNLTNVILRDYPHALAHHDRRLLEEFMAWLSPQVDDVSMTMDDKDGLITAFLAQREGK